jgi:hypothetical protein
MPRAKLTALAVERAQKSGRSVLLSDGDGLYLRKQTRDGASWTLRCRFAGKEHWLTLGWEAESARLCKRAVRNGGYLPAGYHISIRPGAEGSAATAVADGLYTLAM